MSELEPKGNIIDLATRKTKDPDLVDPNVFEAEAESLAQSLSEGLEGNPFAGDPFMVYGYSEIEADESYGPVEPFQPAIEVGSWHHVEPTFFRELKIGNNQSGLPIPQIIEELYPYNEKEFDETAPDTAEAWSKVLFDGSESQSVQVAEVNNLDTKIAVASLGQVVLRYSFRADKNKSSNYEIPLIDVIAMLGKEKSELRDMDPKDFFDLNPRLVEDLGRFIFKLRNNSVEAQNMFYQLVSETSNARVFRYSVKYS